MEILQERVSAVPKTETDHSAALGNIAVIKPQYQIIENNNDDGWRRNYVECVEGRALLLGENGRAGGTGGGGSPEIHQAPRPFKHLPPKDAELQLYSFAPVSTDTLACFFLRVGYGTLTLNIPICLPGIYFPPLWWQLEHSRVSSLVILVPGEVREDEEEEMEVVKMWLWL